MIEIGRLVGIRYEARFADSGMTFDSTDRHGGKLFEFEVGAGQIISGLDRAVSTMSAGEKRTVTVPAAEAYGTWNPALVEEVPTELFPEAEKLQVGGYIVLEMNGEQRRLKVISVDDEKIVFDGNSELCDRDLTFDIEVVSVLGETGTLVEREQHAKGCTCGCHRFKEQTMAG